MMPSVHLSGCAFKCGVDLGCETLSARIVFRSCNGRVPSDEFTDATG